MLHAVVFKYFDHHFTSRKEEKVMPVKITNQLSAVENLLREGIIAITEERAVTQDIRPLKILILNLMPLKKPTELQLLRLLGNNPLQVEVDFARTVTRETTHTDNSYLDKAYLEFADIKDRYYDGFIITGAPVECLEFEEVEYWPELVDYIRWSQDHVFSVLSFCWSAQARHSEAYAATKNFRHLQLRSDSEASSPAAGL